MYVRPLYLAPLYQRKIALGPKGYPWNLHPEVDYHYGPGLCPVAEHMRDEGLLLSSLVREPLTERDMDDLAIAIRMVLARVADLRETADELAVAA